MFKKIVSTLAYLCLFASFFRVNANEVNTPLNERIRRQAVDAFEANDFDKSQSLFLDLIKENPSSSAASFSTNYLKEITIKKGLVGEALQDYEKLKEGGKINPLDLQGAVDKNPFSSLKSNSDLAKEIVNVFNGGGLPSLESLLIGFILNSKGYAEQAYYYYKKSRQQLQSGESINQNYYKLTGLNRPLHLYRGLSMSELREGFRSLEAPRFLEKSKSKPKINQKSNHLVSELGLDWVYNSNVPELGATTALPSDIKRKEGMGQKFVMGFEWIVNPIEATSYGVEYKSTLLNYSRDDLDPYDQWKHVISPWVSNWNYYDFEWRARYALEFELDNSAIWRHAYTAHGPELGCVYQASDHLMVLALISARFLTSIKPQDELDLKKQGQAYQFKFKTFFSKWKSEIKPYFQYKFNRDVAKGAAFHLIGHHASVGTLMPIGPLLEIKTETSYGINLYPKKELSREDSFKEILFQINIPIVFDTLKIKSDLLFNNQGSTRSEYAFTRLETNLGLEMQMKW